RLRMGPATRCPRGWLSFGGHCYGYFGQPLSWRRAEAWCQATRGGHLASLHSPEEHRALAAFLARRPRRGEDDEEGEKERDRDREREESVWIGLQRRRQGWLWADGSPRHYWAWEGDDGPKGHPCIALEDSAGGGALGAGAGDNGLGTMAWGQWPGDSGLGTALCHTGGLSW
uniref:Uncharacterized protein n=1 Tax=Geospiza parvula TaxID=87175 RepID=A0A8C3NJ95_GEOPR